MKREWTITEISTTRKLEATDGQENEWYKKEGGKIQNLNYARTHAHTQSENIRYDSNRNESNEEQRKATLA